MMLEILAPLLLGVAFGLCLHKAGLTHYARIVNVYRLRDLTVIRFMLTALAVAAVTIQAGISLGFIARAPLPMTSLLANVVGGLVFGVGMASAGYCPGTIVAEVGEGRLDALFAGIAGLFVGALSFGLLYPYIMPTLGRIGALGRITLAEWSHAHAWLVVLVFVELVLLILRLTARVGE